MTRFEDFDYETQAESLDSSEIPNLTDELRIVNAVAMAIDNGQYDGENHKQWVIDQMIRILTGDEYEDVIASFENGEDGPRSHEWDTGIIP